MNHLTAFPAPGFETLMMGRFPLVQHVREADTQGAYSAFVQVMPSRALVMPHVHDSHDQLKIVLTGVCGMYVGGDEWRVEAGQMVFGPRGVPHTIWNAGEIDCSFVELTSPGGFESHFYEFAELVKDTEVTLHDREALAARYGVTLLPELARDLAARHGLEL